MGKEDVGGVGEREQDKNMTKIYCMKTFIEIKEQKRNEKKLPTTTTKKDTLEGLPSNMSSL